MNNRTILQAVEASYPLSLLPALCVDCACLRNKELSMLEGWMRDVAVFEGGRGLGVDVGELTPIMSLPLPKMTHMYYGVGDGGEAKYGVVKP